MPKIRMIESAPKGRTFHLTTAGNKIGGFRSGDVFRLANKSDIPLYLLSGDPKGSYEMLKVTGTKIADAKKADGYDPADWGDGYVLVADGDIKPWPVNWLTVDDEDRVFIDIADLGKAVEFLNTKGESASEDRRGTDRYGHPVKRFTAKDLKGLGDGSGDDAGTDDKFGLAYLGTTSMDALSNNFSTSAVDRFLHDIAQMPVSKKSIEDLLRKHQLHKYGRAVGVRDFFPENGIAYLGTYGDDGLPYKTLCLKWGPALKK